MDPSVPGVPASETGAGDQGAFIIGAGGPCEGDLVPAYGYSCSVKGGPRGAGQHMHPSGLRDITPLPNSPYHDPSNAVIHAWRPSHWFTVQYLLANYSDGRPGLNFTRGGFQGAEGFNANAEWYIEGVAEELDASSEFMFVHQPVSDTWELRYITNTTDSALPSAATDSFVATRHRVLFNLSGTLADPVVGVTIRGLVLRDTRESFLSDHGEPSGGDWALPYVAAIVMDNVENSTVSDSLFSRLDGIAIELLGRTRGIRIIDNEFEWLGGSAVVLWSVDITQHYYIVVSSILRSVSHHRPNHRSACFFQNLMPYIHCRGRTSANLNEAGTWKLPSAFHPQGPDSRALDVPLDTLIEGNACHDIGLLQKQSSLLFQAIAARTTLRRNVAYNLPRAAVNLNDDHGGGDIIESNVFANAVRESGDHGGVRYSSLIRSLTF